MKTLTLSIALCASACAAVAQDIDGPTDRRLVTSEELKEIIAATPFECSNYADDSDTCEVLTVLEVDGDKIGGAGKALYSEGFPGTITGEGVLDGNRICMAPENVTFTFDSPDPEMNKMAESQLMAMLESLGTLCTSYYELEAGGYVSVTTMQDGTPIPDGEEAVRFFDEEKALRVVPEEVDI